MNRNPKRQEAPKRTRFEANPPIFIQRNQKTGVATITFDNRQIVDQFEIIAEQIKALTSRLKELEKRQSENLSSLDLLTAAPTSGVSLENEPEPLAGPPSEFVQPGEIAAPETQESTPQSPKVEEEARVKSCPGSPAFCEDMPDEPVPLTRSRKPRRGRRV